MSARYPVIAVRRGVAGYKGAVDTFDPGAAPAAQVAGPAWQSTGYAPGGGANASVTVADADPGAVGAGGLWLQTNAGEGGPEYVRLWVRNAADDGWLSTGPISVLNGDVQLLVGPTATIEVGLDDDASAFAVSGANQVRLNAASTRLGTSVQVELRQGTAEPNTGAGIAAPVGSLYMRQTAVDGVGSLWQKVGAVADTDWAPVFGDASLQVYVASGTISITSPGTISLTADPASNIDLEGLALRLNGDFIAKEAYVDAAIDALAAADVSVAAPLSGDVQSVLEGGVRSVTVSLTSAQILALFTTPIQLIAAPGAGKMVLPLNGIAKLNAGPTPYDTTTTGDLNVGCGEDSVFLQADPSALSEAGDWVLGFSITGLVGAPITEVENQPVLILFADGNPTDGDGTLDVTVYYVIVAV